MMVVLMVVNPLLHIRHLRLPVAPRRIRAMRKPMFNCFPHQPLRRREGLKFVTKINCVCGVLMPFFGLQVEVRITAPLQWGARPGEGAGFHLRVGSVEGTNDDEPSDNLEVHIPSEEVLEALESIRQARAGEDDLRLQQFAIRHRVTRRQASFIYQSCLIILAFCSTLKIKEGFSV